MNKWEVGSASSVLTVGCLLGLIVLVLFYILCVVSLSSLCSRKLPFEDNTRLASMSSC